MEHAALALVVAKVHLVKDDVPSMGGRRALGLLRSSGASKISNSRVAEMEVLLSSASSRPRFREGHTSMEL